MSYIHPCTGRKHPLDISALNEDELNAELEKGYADALNGNVIPVKEAFASLRGELGIVNL